MLEKIKKNNKGFTLVELIVVIAILGVLMAVLVPQYIQYVERSREGTDLSTMSEILHTAEIEAATVEGDVSAVTVTISNNAGDLGVTYASTNSPTVMETAIEQLIAGGKLQSSDGQKMGNQVIVFSESRKASWQAVTTPALAAGDTKAHFTVLTDGKSTLK